MSNNDNKLQVISSLLWKLLERSGTKGVQFIVQVVLARLLAPENFGTIAIVSVFTSLASVFVQSGFSTALIQKKDADELDFSSIFYLNLLVSSLLYILIFVASPLIANYYSNASLVPILRVFSLTLFFGAINSIQNAYVARNMMFKKLFFSSIGAIILSGIVSVIGAFLGIGVWALVLQQLLNQIIITIILWRIVKWRPKLFFSFKRVKVLFSYGWKLLVSSLLNVFFMNVRTLVIGRMYSPSLLGYYNRGEQIPNMIVSNLDGAIQSVMLPTFSSVQDNKKRMKSMVRRSIVTSSFLVFPTMIGMAAIAEPLVILVLTEKWLPSVPYLQIFCISYMFMPIHTANLQAINSLGHTNIFLKLEITKKIISTLLLIFTVPFGIFAISWGTLVSSLSSSIINAYPNGKLLHYKYTEQMKDVIPILVISLTMGLIVYTMNSLELLVWVKLISQIITGILTYLILARTFKIEALEYIVNTIKEYILIRKK